MFKSTLKYIHTKSWNIIYKTNNNDIKYNKNNKIITILFCPQRLLT